MLESIKCEWRFITKGKWKDGYVDVGHDEECPTEGHKLTVMHHNDPEGNRHWCPTGFLTCDECDGIADEPPPYECNFCGEAPR